MNKETNPTPDFLKGSTVDKKGLPLRMSFDERKLDQPYKPTQGFKLTWSHRDGVQIEPTDS